jgi:hypothetical protein
LPHRGSSGGVLTAVRGRSGFRYELEAQNLYFQKRYKNVVGFFTDEYLSTLTEVPTALVSELSSL